MLNDKDLRVIELTPEDMYFEDMEIDNTFLDDPERHFEDEGKEGG